MSREELGDCYLGHAPVCLRLAEETERDEPPLELEHGRLRRQAFPVFATAGCHPTTAGEFDDDLAAEVWELAEHEKVRAIGETGIDYYRETASRAEQRRAFEAQIEIAAERDLPIVIHARDPEGDQ